MKIEPIKIYKRDERGTIYDCGKVRLIDRKKGTVSADHKHPEAEVLFLVRGDVEIEIEGRKEVLSGYHRIEIAPNLHHSIKALTDILLIEDREIS